MYLAAAASAADEHAADADQQFLPGEQREAEAEQRGRSDGVPDEQQPPALERAKEELPAAGGIGEAAGEAR